MLGEPRVINWWKLKSTVDTDVRFALIQLGEKVLGQVVTEIPTGKVLFTVVTMEAETLYFAEFKAEDGTSSYDVPEVRNNYPKAAALWDSQSDYKFPAEEDDLVFDSWENMVIRLA